MCLSIMVDESFRFFFCVCVVIDDVRMLSFHDDATANGLTSRVSANQIGKEESSESLEMSMTLLILSRYET
jgi:hypothetical protein